jgi:hypothetical protein
MALTDPIFPQDLNLKSPVPMFAALDFPALGDQVRGLLLHAFGNAAWVEAHCSKGCQLSFGPAARAAFSVHASVQGSVAAATALNSLYT